MGVPLRRGRRARRGAAALWREAGLPVVKRERTTVSAIGKRWARGARRLLCFTLSLFARSALA